MDSESQLKKLETIISLLETDRASTDDVVEIFTLVLEVIRDTKIELEQSVAKNKGELTDATEKVTEDLQKSKERVEKLIGEIKETKESSRVGIKELSQQLKEEVNKLKALIPTVKDWSHLEAEIKRIEGQIPKIPENLATSEDVAALKEELEKIRKETKKNIASIPRGMTGRRVFQPYRDDLSASCDGSNKTFYLSRAPLRDSHIMVFGTDFPVILRPTIDFTIANKVLTLTAAVPAPLTGSTLIVTYFA